MKEMTMDTNPTTPLLDRSGVPTVIISPTT